MNTNKLHVISILTAAAMLNIGCMSTVSNSVGDAYGSVRNTFSSNKRVSSETEALYAQVRQEDRVRIDQIQHEIKVNEQSRIVSRLVKDRDELKQKRSSLDDKRIRVLADEKAYQLKLAKLEAIDRNQLGDKITNIEAITDVHVDALETQQKRLKLDSEIQVLDIHIHKLEQEINNQQTKLNQISGELSMTDISPIW